MAPPLRMSSPSAEGLLYWSTQLRRCATLEEAAGCLHQACGPECHLVQVHREDRLVVHMGSQDGVVRRVQMGGRFPDGDTFRVMLGLSEPEPAEAELQVLAQAIAWGLGQRDDEFLEAFARLGAGQARERMLISVSHEMRTPLNAIIGFSELLASGRLGDLNPKQARYVGNVASSGRQLLTLVNDLLDLSGPVQLKPASLDLAVVAREVAERHGVSSEGSARAWGDVARVARILDHLVSNARKFTPPEGEVRVVVGPGPSITVRDTGIGMSEEERERLLEPFEQGGSGYGREHSGVGLGLALVRRLLKLQGGRLQLESEPGKGTQVTFTLPAEPCAP